MMSGSAAVEQDREARLTAEMTKAIRRQESNLDYWRTTNANTLGYTAAPGNRPTYKKVTQINLNFPGACLPNVTNGQRHSLNKREQPASTVLLTRSRTSLVPKVTAGPRSQGHSTKTMTPLSKKAMVTDLTCLQLADSLFSSKKSPYAGLLDFWQGRSRYTDYFVDGKDSSNNDDTGSDILSDISVPKHNPLSNAQVRRGTIIPVLHYKTIPSEEEVLHNNNHRDMFYKASAPTTNTSSCTVWTCSNGDKQDSKPQKSILKNGPNKVCPVNESCADSSSKPNESQAGLNCSYKLPTVNNEGKRIANSEIILTLDRITPKCDSRPNSNKSDFRSSAHIEHAVEGLMRDLPSRKRSVRFNATHEIREYTPCEPVTHC